MTFDYSNNQITIIKFTLSSIYDVYFLLKLYIFVTSINLHIYLVCFRFFFLLHIKYI